MRLPLTLRLLLAFLLLLIVVAGGLFALVQTPFGKRQLAGLIESLARTPDFQISIGGIDGFVPSDTVFTDVEIRDADGVWLTIDRAEVSWSPTALLVRDLTVQSIAANHIAVLRLPGAGGPATEETPGFRLPELPVDLQLDAITVAELELAPPVLGTAALLRVEGAGSLSDPETGLDARLSVDKLSGPPGSLDLTLQYVPAAGTLSVEMGLTEAEQGVIAGLLAIPGAPPVTLSLHGSGPLDDWRGTLEAKAGEVAALDGSATITATEDGRRFDAALEGRLAAMLPPAIRPFVGDAARLSAQGLIAGDLVTLDALRLDAAGGALTLSGPIDLAAGTVSLDYALAEGETSVLAALVPQLAYDSLAWTGTIGGSVDRPALTADLSMTGVAAAGLSAARADVALQAQPTLPFGDPQMTIGFGIGATIAGADPGSAALAGLLAPDFTLEGVGEAGLNGLIRGARATVTLPAGRLAVTDAGFDPATRSGGADIALTLPDLGALAPLAGRTLGGEADLAGRLDYDDGTVTVGLGGALVDPRTGTPAIDALLGPRAELDLAASMLPGGVISLDRFSLVGEGASIAADGILQGSDVAAGARVVLNDAGAVAPALSGPLTIDADLSGPLGDPTAGATIRLGRVAYQGRVLEDAVLDLTLGDFAAPSGSLAFSAIAEGLPAQVRSGFSVGEDGRMAFPGFALELASLSVGGDLVLTAERTVNGVLEGRVGDLSDFARLAGQPLAGSATIAANLSSAAGRQNVSLTAEAAGLRAAGMIEATSLTVTGTLSDLLGAQTADLRLAGRNVGLGGQRFSRLDATASGTLAALQVTASGSTGNLGFDGAASIAMTGDQIRVQLASLSGNVAGEPFRLAGPAALTMGDGGLASDGLALTARGGRVTASGSVGDRMDLQVALDAVPLSLAELAMPDLGLTGTLSGSLQLAGTMAAPSGRFDLVASGVSVPQSRQSGFAGFDARAAGTWDGATLSVDGQVSAQGVAPIALSASLPLRMVGGVPAIPPGGAIAATASGEVDLGLVNDFLAAGTSRLTGRALVDLRVGGTLGRLTGSGTVAVQNATFEDPVYGLRLTQIDALLTGAGDRLVLERLSARAGNGGRIAGQGEITLAPDRGLPVSAALTVSNALLLDMPLAAVTASADLRLDGALLATPRLTGGVHIDEAEIDISQQGSSALPTLPVREVNVPPALAAQAAEIAARNAAPADERGAGFAVALGLTVEAPGRVYVRGRGLDAELEGRLTVGGTTAEPSIEGALTMRQGTFDLLGNELAFSRGTITFVGGGGLDPLLDFVATTTAEDAVVEVAVTGRVSRPDIALSSSPELPEDEILARLLFDRATGDLSPLQAVQLAQSAAQLAGFGSGSGLLENVRQNLGLDRLGVEMGNEGQDDVSLTVGKYIGENLYVGVEQGLTQTDTRAEVELQITDAIKAEGSVGSEGGRLGIYMEWDY